MGLSQLWRKQIFVVSCRHLHLSPACCSSQFCCTVWRAFYHLAYRLVFHQVWFLWNLDRVRHADDEPGWKWRCLWLVHVNCSLPFPFCVNFFPPLGEKGFLDLASILTCVPERREDEHSDRKTDRQAIRNLGSKKNIHTKSHIFPGLFCGYLTEGVCWNETLQYNTVQDQVS